MTDIANLGIKIDATDADAASVKLDRLAAAGARAELAHGKMAGAVGRSNDTMRASATAYIEGERGLTASRKAMMDVATAADIMATRQAAGLRTLTAEAHVSSRAVNETIVLSRELSRGNFTRMAGSATILAQSLQSTKSSMGDVFRALGLMLNLIEEVPPAMAAATASELALNDASVLVMEAQAGQTAAILAAAQAKVAAAEREFAGIEGVTRSERRQLVAAINLIGANEELAGAATAAALAEERLALAEGNAARAAGTAAVATDGLAASNAAVGVRGTVAMTGLGTAVAAVATAAAFAGWVFTAAFVSMKDRAGDLTAGMGLTSKQLQKLKDDGVSTSLTLGDVFKGLWKTIKDDLAPSFSVVGAVAAKYFKQVAHNGYELAQQLVGGIVGAAYAIKAIWNDLPAVFSHIGSLISNAFLTAIEWMVNKAIDQLNVLILFANYAGNAIGHNPNLKTAEYVAFDRNKDKNPNAFSDMGADVSAQYDIGDKKGRKWARGQMDTAYNNMVNAGQERINDKDGSPGRDKKGRKGSSGSDPLASEKSFLDNLISETTGMGLNKVEQKLADIKRNADDAAKEGTAAGNALSAAITKAGQAWVEANAHNAATEMLRSMKEQTAEQVYQNSLLGMNIKDQAIAKQQHIFDLSLQRMINDGIVLNTEDQLKLNAAQAVAHKLAEERGQRELNVQNAQNYADAMMALNDNLRAATQSFSELFGTAGAGFSNLISEITGYGNAQIDIQRQITDARNAAVLDQGKIDNLERQFAQNQIQHYGNMLGAAKTFFAQGSAGYKILEAAERAYRIYQLASALIESVNRKKAISEDVAHTGSTVAQSGIRATAHGIEAIARAIASLPFPLNLVAGAATAAALVAVGVKLFGHGGGGGGATGSASSLDTSKITSDSYSSPYSTQPGKNGLYDPSNAGAPPTTSNYGRGGSVFVTTYNIHAPGADAGTVQQIQDMLDNHTANTVTLARQAAAQDAASLAGRQRIGGT